MSVDLGQKERESYPTSPIDRADTTVYPTFHYSGKEPLSLPEEGTMTITFCLKHHVTSEHYEGDTRHEYTIEVQSIEKVNGKCPNCPAKSGSEAGDALDKLMKEHEEDEGDENDEDEKEY